MRPRTEITQRFARLGLEITHLPELAPCAYCNTREGIDIFWSLATGTYVITCVAGDYLTAGHAELCDAIHEWNAIQRTTARRLATRNAS